MSIQQYGRRFPILLEIPSPKGKVELIETIGKGNYGYVYKGKLLASDQTTAVKVVYLKEDELRETLLEMEIIQACHHPNITRFMGSFLKGLDLWICMELCSGGALDSIYRHIKKPLTEEQISALLYEALAGLKYLHDEVHLIHRDIKAGNMFLTEDGELKLGDFGVSAMLSQSGGNASTFIGTPYWMAPEVIMTDPENPNSQNASYNSKADIWSIGITAIELAEKNPPLSDIHPMRALTLIPNSELFLAKPKNFSKSFQDFITQCLTKNPVKRPSAAELLRHPFLVKVSGISRKHIIAEMVQKAKISRENKNQGIEADEDEDEKMTEIPESAIRATMKMATIGNSSQSSESAKQNPIPSICAGDVEFPKFADTLPFADTSVLKILALGKPFKVEILTADIIEKRYIMLGLQSGLYFLDLKKPEQVEPIPLIMGTRFKQIQVLDDYNVMMALSGKNDHIRQYKLSSIKNLIKYVTGTPVSILMKDQTSEDEEYNVVQRKNIDERLVVARWACDYTKIVNTKDSRSFVIQRTEISIFMGVLLKQDVILCEWAKEPYVKFMKLRAFWLPEPPKFIHLLHDGISIRHVYLGYSAEANLVSTEDSKVTEMNVHREFLIKAQGSRKARWQTYEQIPFSEVKRKELQSFRQTATFNRKIAAIAGGHTLNRNGSTESYFLATFHRLTRVVDLSGHPVIGSGVGGWKDGVNWMEPPQKIVLRPGNHAIAIGKQTVEVADWRTAVVLQKLDVDGSSVNIKVMAITDDTILLLVERKKKNFKLFLLKEKIMKPQAIIPAQEQPRSVSLFTVEGDKKVKSPTAIQIPNVVHKLEKLELTASTVVPSVFSPSETVHQSQSYSGNSIASSRPSEQSFSLPSQGRIPISLAGNLQSPVISSGNPYSITSSYHPVSPVLEGREQSQPPSAQVSGSPNLDHLLNSNLEQK